MPSEWAMKKAEVLLNIFDVRSSKKALGLAIAVEIDAARAQGMEEAAMIAETPKSRDICLAIRTRIAQLKEKK